MNNKPEHIMLRLTKEESLELEYLMEYMRTKVKTKSIIEAFSMFVTHDKKIRDLEDALKREKNIREERKAINDNFVDNLHQMMRIKESDR